MPFSQHAILITILRFPCTLARLPRAVKARMHAFPFFEPCVPNHTVKGGAPLSSTSKEQMRCTSTGAKRRSLFSKKSSSTTPPPLSPGQPAISHKPVDVEASNESPIILIDVRVAPLSPICVPPVRDCAGQKMNDSDFHSQLPIGTKITDRFWPEPDAESSGRDEALWKGGPASPVNALRPPPYHRRSRSADMPSRCVTFWHYNIGL